MALPLFLSLERVCVSACAHNGSIVTPLLCLHGRRYWPPHPCERQHDSILLVAGVLPGYDFPLGGPPWFRVQMV